MAIVKRERTTKSNGKVLVSWQVRWRYLGNGPVQTVTMDSVGDAKAMDAAVKELGNAILKTDPRVVTRSLIGARVEETAETRQEAAERSLTVRQVFTEWMARPEELAPGTGKRDRTTCNRLGTFGDRPLGALTKAEVWAWLKGLTKANGMPLADGTKRNTAVALRAALSAKAYGHVVDAEWFKDPEVVVHPEYLTPEQQASLITAAKAEGVGLPAKVALFCGLRLGEVLGLQVKHLDLTEDLAMIRVRQSLPEDAPVAGGFRPGRLKTKSMARRDVPIPAWLAWELEDHVRGLPRDAVVFRPTAAAAHLYGPGAVRQARVSRGDFWARGTFHRRWRQACQAAAGVPDGTRFHDMRHTFAKDMLEDNTPPHIVAELMGDTLDVVVKTYAGFGSTSLALARERMNRRAMAS